MAADRQQMQSTVCAKEAELENAAMQLQQLR